jgi:hypothetical protein
MNQRGCVVWLGYVLLWIALSTLTAFALWQAHVALLYLAALIIENPQLRPVGWSTRSLVGVSKLSILILGSAWLMFTVYLEQSLRNSVIAQRLIKQSVKYGVVIGIFWGMAWLVLRV